MSKVTSLEKAIAALKFERQIIDAAIAKLEAQRPKPAAIKVVKPAKAEGQKL